MTSEGSVRKLTRSQLRETRPVYREQVIHDWCSSLLQYIQHCNRLPVSAVCVCLSQCAMHDRTLRRFANDPDVCYAVSRSKFVSSTLPHARLHDQTVKQTCCNHWDPRRAVSERTRDKLVSEPSDGPVKRVFEAYSQRQKTEYHLQARE